MKADKTDLPRFALSDIPAAIGFLTRIPVPVNGEKAAARGARAAWAYPLAGAIVGVLGAIIGSILIALEQPPELAAALALFAMVVITGALHEDGLADCADGFWGGDTPERRLEIMKDSRIGAYGVIAVVFSLLIRWMALTILFKAGFVWAAPVAAAVASRTYMVLVMAHLPQARTDGLAASVGKPDLWVAIVGFVLGAAMLFGVDVPFAIASCYAFLLAVFVPVLIAQRKIGGQTGDVLGATQQWSEIVLLLTFLAYI